MADSDYDFSDNGSDDEYMASRPSASSSRAATRAPGKRKADGRKKTAASALTTSTGDSSPTTQTYNFDETDYAATLNDGDSLQKTVQELEESRKRKRLRKETKPFQRGIIRHVVLVLDLSSAMEDKDMRPSRYTAMLTYAVEYVREFFEQNPISQMSVLGMRDGICIRISELLGNPAEHIDAIQKLRPPRESPKGVASLQNALELARATLYHTPKHGTRECIIVLGALMSLDPGDIHKTISNCVRDGMRCSVIGMGARMKICSEIVAKTNAGDESEYVVATDQELLREYLLATTTPPVVRNTQGATGPAGTSSTAPRANDSAALMMMGFPSRVVEDLPTLCACHGILTTGGYTCSRCEAKVCSLPITCPSCQLTLLLSTHLARSYHHLFPLRNWAEVSWRRAREKGTKECLACLAKFPEVPPEKGVGDEMEIDGVDEMARANGTNGTSKASRGGSDAVDGLNGKKDEDDDSEEQKASESSRYECRVCESHFCIDCDLFCHEVLHNCPGCLSREGASA